MKTVACYVRVSTENQLENYSIEEQIERLKAYCKAKDYLIYKIYTDGGFSGGNTNRPALQTMLTDIELGRVEAVVVYKLDRLSRSQKDTLTLIEDEFLSHEIDFISVCENFDTTTPFGRAMIGILSVFAQLEKDQITERFTMGRIGRSKSGFYHGGGNTPKGYRYIDGKLVIENYEAMQVREIYDLFLSGNSINAISHTMADKYGKLWDNSNKISNALKRAVYCGRVKFNGVEYAGQHEPIVSEETFSQVQKLLQSRDETIPTDRKTPFRADYLLSSLIFCEHCGARYSANHGYYKCYSRAKATKRFVTDPNCKNKNWVIQDLDSLVLSEIQKLTFGDNLQNLLVELTPSETTQKNEKDAIRKNIRSVEIQISKLLDLYQMENMPVDEIARKISALQEEKNKLQAVEASAPQDCKDQKKEDFVKTLQRFDTVLMQGVEEQRMFVSALVQRIIIDDETAKIEWRL